MEDVTSEIKKIKNSKKYKDIKKSLLKALRDNGSETEFYVDLIDDYMNLYINKTLLFKDIEKRGVIVEYDNGGGQKGSRKNDSVAEHYKTNEKMTNLLSKLGIDPSKNGGDDVEL